MIYLKKDEVPAVRGLVRSFMKHFNEEKHYKSVVKRMAGSYNDALNGVVITDDKDHPTCFSWAHKFNSLLTDEPMLYVSCIYVIKSKRGSGKCIKMIEKLKEYGEINGCDKLILTGRDDKTCKLWEGVGANLTEWVTELEL